MVVMVLVPAFGEEFFFRGVLQKLFQRSIGVRGAVLASAACFALAHQQPLSFIPLLFMGILLGYTKYWTGSLWAPILLHSINNGFALLSSYAAGGELQTESTMALGWSIVGLVPLVIGILWLRNIRGKTYRLDAPIIQKLKTNKKAGPKGTGFRYIAFSLLSCLSCTMLLHLLAAENYS